MRKRFSSYRNEAQFSSALVATMRRNGWFVQRIESHETGRGIPDIYAISPTKQAMWLELKRMYQTAEPLASITWRPGQQSWLHSVNARGQASYTIACFDDEIWLIPMNKLYTNSVVARKDVHVYTSIKELLS